MSTMGMAGFTPVVVVESIRTMWGVRVTRSSRCTRTSASARIGPLAEPRWMRSAAVPCAMPVTQSSPLDGSGPPLVAFTLRMEGLELLA
jgi:hypothetical protein